MDRAKSFAHYLKTNASVHPPGLFHSNLQYAFDTVSELRGLVGCSIGVALIWILYRGAWLATTFSVSSWSFLYYLLLLCMVVVIYTIVSRVIEQDKSYIWTRVALLAYSIHGFVPLVTRLSYYVVYSLQRKNKYAELRAKFQPVATSIENGTMLSLDALALVMQHSECKDLSNMSLVCKHWHEASQNELLWQYMNKKFAKYRKMRKKPGKLQIRRTLYEMMFKKQPEKAKFTSLYAYGDNSEHGIFACMINNV